MDALKSIIGNFKGIIFAVFVALLSFLSGATTDIGQALQIALDPQKALTQAAVLINETPKEEIVEAVKENAEDPEGVLDTITNIKNGEVTTE